MANTAKDDNIARIALRPNGQSVAIPQRLLVEISKAISNIRGWGSVEIFIQDHKVTQITERNINKPDTSLYTSDEFMS